MKKILCVVLMMTLLLAACGSNDTGKTEERLKEEIRAELEAEAKLKEEVEAALKAEEEKKEEVDESVSTEGDRKSMHIIDGTLIPAGPPFGVVAIKFEDTITIRREFDQGDDRIIECNEIYIMDLNGMNVHDYIDKKHLAFYEPVITVSEGTDISIKVKLDISEFLSLRDSGTDDSVTAKLLELIEINGSAELVDMTSTKYSLDTCKAIFQAYLEHAKHLEDGFCPKDVKEFKLYDENSEAGKLFRESVDGILEEGLFINMGEGEYYIETEQKTYNE